VREYLITFQKKSSNLKKRIQGVLKMNFMAFILLIFSMNSMASLDNQNKTWLGIFAKKKLQHYDYSFWQELQYRYDHEEGGMEQILTRFGLLKNLSDSHELGVMIAYIQTGNTREYRPTLQHVYNTASDQHKFLFRSRLEWRDQEENPANSIRYRLMNSYRYQWNPTYSVLIWDEPFINLTQEKWTGNRTLERNRLFLGVRIDQSDERFEIGYMNQYVPRKDQDISEHILVGYFFF
jgi:hypothetical protein